MYLYESMWILVGVLVGLVASRIIAVGAKRQKLTVGWVVTDKDNAILGPIHLDRMDAFAAMKQKGATRCRRVYVDV